MPIIKHEEFSVISRKEIDSLDDYKSIALYVFLLTRPQELVINERVIKYYLCIGDVAYKKSMKELIDRGYVKIRKNILHFDPMPGTD